MTDLRDQIADIINRETNARLVQDEIDILNGHDVAQSIIAALPGMVAAENKRLQEALDGLVDAARRASHATTNDGITGPIHTDEAVALQHALAALQAGPLGLKYIGIVQDAPEGPAAQGDSAQ